MNDHEFWSGGNAGHVVPVWNGDLPEVCFIRADGAEEHWRFDGSQVLLGHIRPDGYAFSEGSFGWIPGKVVREVRRACERRTVTPAAALRRLIEASCR